MAGKAVERDVAVLFGKDVGKARREAVVVEASVEQGEGQHHRVVTAGLAEGGQGRVIAGDEIAGLKSGRKTPKQILLIAAADPDTVANSCTECQSIQRLPKAQ